MVLTDVEMKAKYDNHRVRTTRASGIRGNPWQNAGKEWAPPPRHPAFAQRSASSTQKRQSAASNADRFAEFTASAPRRPAGRKAESSSHTWQAWEDMRSGAKSKTGNKTGGQSSGTSRASSYAAPPPPPPPVPPRPSPHKQPKGAFGTRVQKGGYVPESPGDEPSVTNNNYFTTRTHTNLFNETSTATRARRRAPSDASRDDSFVDSRQSTPYQTQGGEKFDPWSGASNISRSRSTREQNRKAYDDEEQAHASPRHRSASVPDDSDNAAQAKRGGNEGFNFSGHQDGGPTSANGEFQTQEDFKNGGAANGKDSPKLYANQSHYSSKRPSLPKAPLKKVSPQARRARGRAADEDFYSQKSVNLPPELQELLAQEYAAKATSSSEDQSWPHGRLNAFEQNLRQQIIRTLSGAKYGPGISRTSGPAKQTHIADETNTNSFGSQFPGNSFANDSPRFTRNSTDNINTKFVAEEDATNWQFNAGSPVDESGRPAIPRTKSGSRAGRGSPFNPSTSQNPFAAPPNGGHGAQNGSFNPEEWSEKIGPQIFEAPAAQQRTSVPASRPVRNASKKAKPVRMTAGTAGMVESDESSSGQEEFHNSKGQPASGRGHGGVDGAASPNAMDVDPPSVSTSGENSVRNIPVTPSRPEWRAGDVGLGINVNAKTGSAGQQAGFSPPAGGSEDTEEFRASFADFRNVEPFAERATGLESFGDLKSTLPFPSAASAPVRKPVQKTHNIAFPEQPKPPAAPPALAVPTLKPSAVGWKKYVEDFSKYLAEFSAYNAMFIDHFAARKIQINEKLADPTWLGSRDAAGIQQYMTWAEEDREVREKWADAHNKHVLNVRLFSVHRDKMMK